MSRYLRHVGSEPDFHPLNKKHFALVLIGIVVGIVAVAFIIRNRAIARATVFVGFLTMLAIFAYMGSKGSERERKGLISVLILTGLGMLFFIFYQQTSTSLTLFSLRGFIMGVWFLATGISQYLGSHVATYASVPQSLTNPVDTLPLYTNLFIKLGVVAVIGTVIATALIPMMKKLSVVAEGPSEDAA